LVLGFESHEFLLLPKEVDVRQVKEVLVEISIVALPEQLGVGHVRELGGCGSVHHTRGLAAVNDLAQI